LYLGVFDSIRELFAMTPRALTEGMSASTFSFNGGTDAVNAATGAASKRSRCNSLATSSSAARNAKAAATAARAEDRSRGKEHLDVLGMTVSDAIVFFGKLKANRITKPLSVLEEVGLGYLRLGQPLNILSGGESQRLKLVER
jgi:excinuclease ABC subunit A